MLPHLPLSPIWEQEALAAQQGETERETSCTGKSFLRSRTIFTSAKRMKKIELDIKADNLYLQRSVFVQNKQSTL